jgi:predicted Zn-dependent protease
MPDTRKSIPKIGGVAINSIFGANLTETVSFAFMNKSFRSFLLLACCIGLLAIACKGPDNKNDDESEAVLRKPPFARLTDSIRQSGSADAAGLYFRRAELLSRNNLHELAAEDYKKSWETHPEETTGIRYASTLSILGQTDDAIKLLKDCLQRFPANTNFPGLLGDCYIQSGKTKEALDLYNNMLAKDSLDFEAWYEKGLVLEQTKDTAGAIASLRKAYAIQPVNTYALELAHLYAERGNDKALLLCDEVMRKDPRTELLDPIFIKGIYYSNTSQYKKAIVQFDSCIGRDWKFTDAYLEKGIAQFEQKNYEEAMKTFLMTIKVSNTYPDGYFWVGRCYEAMGSKDDAVLYYQRALALDRDFTEAAEAIKRLK